MMQIKSNYILYFLLFVIIILAGILIFRKPVTIIDTPSKIIELKKSIARKDFLIKTYRQEAERLEFDAQGLSAEVDSLERIKQKVKIKYRETYINIDNARNEQLDSIIRSSW